MKIWITFQTSYSVFICLESTRCVYLICARWCWSTSRWNVNVNLIFSYRQKEGNRKGRRRRRRVLEGFSLPSQNSLLHDRWACLQRLRVKWGSPLPLCERIHWWRYDTQLFPPFMCKLQIEAGENFFFKIIYWCIFFSYFIFLFFFFTNMCIFCV